MHHRAWLWDWDNGCLGNALSSENKDDVEGSKEHDAEEEVAVSTGDVDHGRC